MRNKNILISGASIAGPALAFWLNRRGFSTTVVEKAPALRAGGQAVDFRGAQMDVLRRMGLLEDIRAKQTSMGELRVLDESRRQVATLPPEFASGEVEILRGDLSRILFDATKQRTEYIFGDWITSLEETGDGVEVTFANGGPRRFDLVVGADGLHSGVRAMAFGPESRYRTDMGYYFAGYSAPNHLRLDHVGLIYNGAGKGVMVSAQDQEGPAGVSFVFTSEPLDYDRHDLEQQKKILVDRYRDLGWEVPTLLDALTDATDLFFDPLCQMHLERYTRGRVALVGDAGWGAGPGGSGTGLPMLAAYVFAGELAAAGGDHTVAFPRYEAEVRPAAEAGLKQAKGMGPFLAPATAKKIKRRNRIYRMVSRRPFLWFFQKMATKAANTLVLKDY